MNLPLGAKRWIYTKSVVALERDEYGVYELLDSMGNILYIGHGKIMTSLLKHLDDGEYPVAGAHCFSVEYTWDRTKSETRHREELAKYHKEYGTHPKFN